MIVPTALLRFAAVLCLILSDVGRSSFIPGSKFTNDQFMQATWDWIQRSGTAPAAWGPIEDWDTSDVTTFRRAFCDYRSEDAMVWANANSAVQSFNGGTSEKGS
jgi:hypothetical protein